MSRPTVFATLSLKSAPTRLSVAPRKTARAGDSTRVQTAVAIALAASFQPFARLNSSAPAMTRTVTKVSWSIDRPGSGVPDHDRLDHVRHVGARVGGELEVAVDVLPLDDLERIVLLVEER